MNLLPFYNAGLRALCTVLFVQTGEENQFNIEAQFSTCNFSWQNNRYPINCQSDGSANSRRQLWAQCAPSSKISQDARHFIVTEITWTSGSEQYFSTPKKRKKIDFWLLYTNRSNTICVAAHHMVPRKTNMIMFDKMVSTPELNHLMPYADHM